MNLKFLSIGIALILGLTLAGCDASADKQASSTPQVTTGAPAAGSSTSATAVAAPAAVAELERVLIKHTRGETEVPAHPHKVIVFDTALLDSLALLDVPIAGVPQPKIPFPEGIARYKDKRYLNVGTLQEPNFEAINAAEPDLIISSGRAERAYDELLAIAPTIEFSVDWKNFRQSFGDQLLTVARLFDKEDQARQELEKLDKAIAETKLKASKAGSALFILVTGGRISAYGPGSRFGFIFDELGMQPAGTFADQGLHGNLISMEYVRELDPEWIFVLDRDTAIGESQANAAAKKVMDNELIQATKAFKDNHVVYVDSSSLYLAGGLQSLQELVRTVNEAVSR